ncbi:probable acylpyruvase FAHD1, mitochondrial [Rosa rugosa]|uniref:probable acylpyruvase FAHD1, mitochondrial n=1 Tax=Rosa rugosa TaxID=74645 RepID=UPI002B40142E|nr:probable acylpyruvase FAHD1, mitochondrial [Rosa rugosa]
MKKILRSSSVCFRVARNFTFFVFQLVFLYFLCFVNFCGSHFTFEFYKNYAAHAKELDNAVPKEPVLFLKPTSSYLENGGSIEIPHPLESLDHEVELAVIISKKACDVPQAKAMDYVGGYALALDMTAREIQATAKEMMEKNGNALKS